LVLVSLTTKNKLFGMSSSPQNEPEEPATAQTPKEEISAADPRHVLWVRGSELFSRRQWLWIHSIWECHQSL